MKAEIIRMDPKAPVLKAGTFKGLLELFKPQLAQALPKHLTVERVMMAAMTAVNTTPKLLACTQESVIKSILDAASLGLDMSGQLHHGYLIPYGRECHFELGYRGMIDLARRSGQIISISARPVYEGDTFEVHYGTRDEITHTPNFEVEQTEKTLLFTYAVAKLHGGGIQFHVSSRAEINDARRRSKSDGTWRSDYVPMALKTSVKRLWKYLPISVERVDRAIYVEDAAARGESVPVLGVEPPDLKSREDELLDMLSSAPEVAVDDETIPEWKG